MSGVLGWSSEIISDLTLLALGLRFFITWNHPYFFGPNAVTNLTSLIVFAFFQVFFSFMAGGLMVLREVRYDWIAFLAIVVTALFVLAFAASVSSGLNRQGAFYDLLLLIVTQTARFLWSPLPSPGEKTYITVNVVSMLVLYIVFLVLAATLPIPQLGFTPEVLSRITIPPGGGDFHKNPHWAMFAGTCYYLSLAIIRMLTTMILLTRHVR